MHFASSAQQHTRQIGCCYGFALSFQLSQIYISQTFVPCIGQFLSEVKVGMKQESYFFNHHKVCAGASSTISAHKCHLSADSPYWHWTASRSEASSSAVKSFFLLQGLVYTYLYEKVCQLLLQAICIIKVGDLEVVARYHHGFHYIFCARVCPRSFLFYIFSSQLLTLGTRTSGRDNLTQTM